MERQYTEWEEICLLPSLPPILPLVLSPLSLPPFLYLAGSYYTAYSGLELIIFALLSLARGLWALPQSLTYIRLSVVRFCC